MVLFTWFSVLLVGMLIPSVLFLLVVFPVDVSNGSDLVLDVET